MSASERRKSTARKAKAPAGKSKTPGGKQHAPARKRAPVRKKSTGAVRGIHPALRDLPMLEFVPAELRRLVSDSFVPLEFPFGEVIVREGEEADALFVLASGRARAIKEGEGGDEVPLGVLHPGDTFGELGMVEDSTRTATVRASSDVEALRLDRSIFRALLNSSPELRESVELHVRRLKLED